MKAEVTGSLSSSEWKPLSSSSAGFVHLDRLRGATGVEGAGVVSELHLSVLTGDGQCGEFGALCRVTVAEEAEEHPPWGFAVFPGDVLPEQRAVGEHLVGEQTVAGGVSGHLVAGHPAEAAEVASERHSLAEPVAPVQPLIDELLRFGGKCFDGGGIFRGDRRKQSGIQSIQFSEGCGDIAVPIFFQRGKAGQLFAQFPQPEQPPAVVDSEIEAVECRIEFLRIAVGQSGREIPPHGKQILFQLRNFDLPAAQVVEVVENPVEIPADAVGAVEVQCRLLRFERLRVGRGEAEVPAAAAAA